MTPAPASFRILIVEAEPAMRGELRALLLGEGYAVSEASTGAAALSLLAQGEPSLMLLELDLPDVDGLDLARQMRGLSPAPIVIVSRRADEQSLIEALDNGADDFVSKPIREPVLLARIRACLRHAVPASEPRADGVRVDALRRVAFVSGREVRLSATEHKLLWSLLRARGNVITHQQLLREVWGAAYTRDAGYLRVYMHHLRGKLESDPSHPRWLHTEPGVGYRLSG